VAQRRGPLTCEPALLQLRPGLWTWSTANDSSGAPRCPRTGSPRASPRPQAVVVDSGDHLQLGGVLKQNPSHHVHLPQLHRTLPLPAAELVAALAPAPELDQLVPTQAPVDGRTRGRRVHAPARELVFDPAGTPARVLPAQLADQCFDLGIDLVRARGRAVGVVGQRGQSALLVARDPGVDGLARDAHAPGELDHPPAVLHHREHRLIPLFHDAELHQHGPPPETRRAASSITRSHRQGSAEARVVDQPELRQGSGDAGTSSITRNTTGLCSGGGTRTHNLRINSPPLCQLSYPG
jgi:hypothetical protein